MSKITICEGNIILTSKKETLLHAFDGSITTYAQQKNIWKGEKGTIIGEYTPINIEEETSVKSIECITKLDEGSANDGSGTPLTEVFTISAKEIELGNAKHINEWV